MIDFAKYHHKLRDFNPIQVHGKVSEIVGLVVEGHGPAVSLGELCAIHPAGAGKPIAAEVVGFKKGKVLLMPLDTIQGLSPGSRIVSLGRKASVEIGPQFLGRVIDGLGQPIDDQGPIEMGAAYPIYADPINPLKRGRINEPIDLGIKAINGVLTCGKGQRMGIFAGSGVGKSVLLGMIARNTKADVNVIGLIGERGREVREFLEKNLGKEGLSRSIVVVAATDSHPLIRMRAAYVATSISEYFRDREGRPAHGRFSHPFCHGPAGSAFPWETADDQGLHLRLQPLPKLLERTGKMEDRGSITGLYTILVEGDDFNEPVADAARSILDGHITLTRDLANRGHYPAVDVLQSISRVMIDIVDEQQRGMANNIQNILATYKKAEDLINIGAYVKGSNPDIDYAVGMIDRVNDFLRQNIHEKIDLTKTRKQMDNLFKGN